MPTKQWYKQNKAKSKKYNQAWQQSHKDYFAAYFRAYRKTHKLHRKYKPKTGLTLLKYNCRQTTRRAIKKGKLIRENCFCGLIGQAHHENYNEPYKIIWLCRLHHAEHHSKN